MNRRPHRTRRRILLGIAIMLLIVWGLLALAERYLFLERYRPLVEQAVLDATGLPIAFDTLDLRWTPLSVTLVQPLIQGDGFLLQSTRVRAVPRLKPLLRGVLELDRLEVEAPEIILSGDPEKLRGAVAAFQAHQKSKVRDTQDTPGRFSLDRITLHGGLISLEGDPEPLARFEGEVLAPLGPEARITMAVQFPGWGAGASATGEATVQRTPGQPPEVRGTAALRGLELQAMSSRPQVPPIRLDVDVETRDARKDRVCLAFSGVLSPLEDASEMVRDLAGDCSGEMVWEPETVSARVAWSASGGDGEATWSGPPSGPYRVEVGRLVLEHNTLVALAPLAGNDRYQFVIREEAGLEALGVVVEGIPDRPSIQMGSASLFGVDLSGPRGGVVLSDLRLEATAADDVFKVTQARAEGLEFAGSLTPQPSGAVLELTGGGTVSKSQLDALVDLGPVTQAAGTVHLDRLMVRIGGEDPANRVEAKGTLTNGLFAVTTPRYTDSLSAIEGQFTATDHDLAVDTAGVSEQFGSIRGKGTYTYADRRWDGETQIDMGAWKPPIDPESLPGKLAMAGLRQWGPSTLHVQVTGPDHEHRQVMVAWERKDTPSLAGTLRVIQHQQAWRLDDIEIASALDASSLLPVLHGNLVGSGPVAIRFAKRSGEDRFSAHADLTPVHLQWKEQLDKPAGMSASVTLGGGAADRWSPDLLDVAVLDESLSAHLGPEGLVTESLDVTLTSLGGLLRGGLVPDGRVTGSLHTQPFRAELQLHEVSLRSPGGPVIESASGPIRIDEAGLTLEQVALRAPGFQGVLDLRYGSGAWEGALTGDHADLLQVLELPGRLRPQKAEGEARGDEAPAANHFPDGMLDVQIKELLFRNTPLDDTSATVRATGGAIVVEKLRARPMTGSMTGTIRVERQTEGGLPWVDLDLTFEQAGMEALDALLFEKPRGFLGVFDGAAELHFPVGTGQPPLHRASGAMVFHAKEGSFGQFGFATQLLSVLRTTELITLRPTTGRAGGLAFNSSNVALEMDNGVITLHTFAVENPTLKLQAMGTVDLPADRTDVRIQTSVLGAVSGVVGALGLDTVSRGIERYSSLELLATGSPASPTITLNPAAPAHVIKDSIVGSESIPNMVLQTPRDLLRGLLGRGRGKEN